MYALVVNDDRVLMTLIQEHLRILGWQSLARFDGEEALLVLEEATELPRFIITDLQMPNKDGYALIRDIRSHDRFLAIPVIVFSSVCDSDKTAHELGADCCITQLTKNEIKRAIKTCSEDP